MSNRNDAAILCASFVAFVFSGSALLAQGTMSSQGFGYPPGQMSTRALGTGGAVAEIDGRSPLNPAALAIRPGAEVFAQYDPELRTVTGPGGTSRTTTSRFPNFGAILPVSHKWVLGFSASTLLDRTWATQSTAIEDIGTDTATATQTLRSEGGITDLRLGVAYAFKDRVRLGIAGHGYVGSTHTGLDKRFADTLRYQSIVQNSVLNYSGSAFSAGVEADILPSLSLAVSARAGSTLKLFAGDTLLTTATVPRKYAASISFSGIPSTLLAVRGSREEWSSLTKLSTANATGVDATEVNAGLESAGPKVRGQSVLIRLGFRHRTLPFTVGATTITETSFGGGLGIPIPTPGGGDGSTLDLAILRSTRTGVTGFTEHAYNLSFGLRVRP